MKQQTDYYSAPACLSRILGVDQDFAAMFAHTSPEIGTTPENIQAALRFLGIECLVKCDEMHQPGDILLIQSEGYGHWVIAESWESYWDPSDDSIKDMTDVDPKALIDGEWYHSLVVRIGKKY